MLEKILELFGIRKTPKKDFGKRCILIVDDNLTDLKLVQRTVEKMGHRALTAENGQIGYEIAKTEKPDLILSDCYMPEQTGVQMCRRIKEDSEIKDIPFVFLTGINAPNTVVECFDLGVDNYICKPINPKILTDQITDIFREHFSPAA